MVITRPLHELLAKDIAIYNRYLNLQSVIIPTLTTKAKTKASIDHLIEGKKNG